MSRWAGIAVVTVVMLAGCRSSSDKATPPTTVPVTSTTEPPTTTTEAPTTVAGPEPCRSAQLRAALLPREGAAGTSFLTIELRNMSETACALQGFPDVSLQDRSGQQVGRDPQQVPGLPPGATEDQVTVEPARSAHFVVSFSNVESPDGPPCPDVSTIAVTPPGESEPLVVDVNELLAPCGNERVGPVTPPRSS